MIATLVAICFGAHDASSFAAQAKPLTKVVVGYGSGGLATIDPMTRNVVSGAPLPAHPEGFQLDPAGTLIYVNLPNAHQILIR